MAVILHTTSVVVVQIVQVGFVVPDLQTRVLLWVIIVRANRLRLQPQQLHPLFLHLHAILQHQFIPAELLVLRLIGLDNKVGLIIRFRGMEVVELTMQESTPPRLLTLALHRI